MDSRKDRKSRLPAHNHRLREPRKSRILTAEVARCNSPENQSEALAIPLTRLEYVARILATLSRIYGSVVIGIREPNGPRRRPRAVLPTVTHLTMVDCTCKIVRFGRLTW